MKRRSPDMTTFQNNSGNGGPAGGNGPSQGPGIGQRVDQMGNDAQHLWDNARGAVTDLRDTMDLRGRAGGNEVTKLPTVHQNSINKLRVYQESGGQVQKISTAGVDGRVVVWDL